MSDEIKLCRRFFDEVCNGRQLGTADQLFSSTHIYHDPSSTWVGTGPKGMKDLIGAYHGAVNNAHWQVHTMMLAGDVVITRWSGSGTHTGELLGIPATGKSVKVDGIWMHRVSQGRIVESWNYWDMLGLLQQIGVLPMIGTGETQVTIEDRNIAVVKKAYELFNKGDMRGLLNQFADDIDWETPGSPVVPYAGHFRGRNEVAGFFDGLNRTAAIDTFEPREVIAKGDRVIVLGFYSGQGRMTHRPFATNWAMAFTVQNEKITKFHECLDTANLGNAFN